MEERTAGRGFLILSIAGILGKILSALYVPFLKGILGPGGYGIYAVGYDIFIFLIAVSSLGAQPAVTKVVTELRVLGNGKDALRAMKVARKYLALMGGALTIIFVLLSVPIAKIFNADKSALSFKFLAPAIFLAAILAAYRGYMQGIEDMKSLAISQVLEQLFNVILSLVFAFLLLKASNKDLAWGSAGGTIGTSLGAIVAIVYILYIYEKRNYEDEANDITTTKKKVSEKKILKKLVIYGLPITIVAAMQNFAGIVDALTVGNRLIFAGFTDVDKDIYYGYLNQYKTMIYVPLTIITALGTSIFPRIIQAFIERNRKDLRRQMSYAFRLTYIISIPSAFGLAILSKEIYGFLFNDTFKYELLMFGSGVLILMSITTIQNVILQGINKMYLIMVTAGLGLIAKLLCNYFLVGIININIMGAVIGNFLAFGIPAVINHIKLQKTFKIKIPIIKQSIVPLISSIVMSFTIIFIRIPLFRLFSILGVEGRLVTAIGTMILMAIGGVVYLVVMVYFGGIRKIDLDMVSPRLYTLMPRGIRKQLG
ncbi:putative polysaccharide biosynthesis protein [Clostridium gasigenes]|uniref:Polysaccharide biosynthesis protein n=1 Tax=Clostridium gasigenes TaxID=94869 RepID=A0A7X0SBA0_9CLOT|nr:polysaccharide biosynthesis protein [Clostridium gasigenes]MBB6714379.1 polysaccharide biosynthesis protein [Clostridium gasigenes]